MTPEQSLAVLRKVVAYCPAMAGQVGHGGEAHLAWAEALAHVDFTDACTAVANLGTKPLEPGQTLWIQPGHVIAEVRRIRHKRIEQTEGRLTGAPEDAAGYLAWLKRSREELGDGTYMPPAIESTGHTIAELPTRRRRP